MKTSLLLILTLAPLLTIAATISIKGFIKSVNRKINEGIKEHYNIRYFYDLAENVPVKNLDVDTDELAKYYQETNENVEILACSLKKHLRIIEDAQFSKKRKNKILEITGVALKKAYSDEDFAFIFASYAIERVNTRYGDKGRGENFILNFIIKTTTNTTFNAAVIKGLEEKGAYLGYFEKNYPTELIESN